MLATHVAKGTTSLFRLAAVVEISTLVVTISEAGAAVTREATKQLMVTACVKRRMMVLVGESRLFPTSVA